MEGSRDGGDILGGGGEGKAPLELSPPHERVPTCDGRGRGLGVTAESPPPRGLTRTGEATSPTVGDSVADACVDTTQGGGGTHGVEAESPPPVAALSTPLDSGARRADTSNGGSTDGIVETGQHSVEQVHSYGINEKGRGTGVRKAWGWAHSARRTPGAHSA